MRLWNDTHALVRPLADAQYYALSPRQKLAYLTRILLELDRLQRRTLRGEPNGPASGETAAADAAYSGREAPVRDSTERASSPSSLSRSAP
jgi:hypothetical protein